MLPATMTQQPGVLGTGALFFSPARLLCDALDIANRFKKRPGSTRIRKSLGLYVAQQRHPTKLIGTHINSVATRQIVSLKTFLAVF